MNIDVTQDIKVDISYLTKKNKTDNTKYTIYISFAIYQQGLRQFNPHTISTGINVNVSDWYKGKVKGKSATVDNINERLFEYFHNAKHLITQLSTKNIKTCGNILAEIKSNATLAVTGKAPRGKKIEFISIMQEHSYEKIMNKKLAEKTLDKKRVEGYKYCHELLVKFFDAKYNGYMPPINLIDKTMLTEFKLWLTKNYVLKQNTLTDYMTKIIAVFNYALKNDIIIKSPIPDGFRGSFVDGEREVLSVDECKLLKNLDDNTLTNSEQKMKYSILVQMLTGMGYSEMASVTYKQIIFQTSERLSYIKKPREKTKVWFTVFLTPQAKQYVDKLIELAGDEFKPFNLPDISFAIRQYKIIGLKAGVSTKLATYTLRHTFAVDYMNSGGTLENLKEILGHEEISTTAIYGKISEQRLAGESRQLALKSKIHKEEEPTQINQTPIKKLGIIRELPAQRSNAS